MPQSLCGQNAAAARVGFDWMIVVPVPVELAGSPEVADDTFKAGAPFIGLAIGLSRGRAIFALC